MLKDFKIIYGIIKSLPNKRKGLTLPIIFMAVASIISLTIPLFAMNVIDSLKNNKLLEINSLLTLMFFWMLSLVVVAIFGYHQGNMFKTFSIRNIKDIQEKVIEYYFEKKYLFWNSINSKELSEEIRKDLEDFEIVLSGSFFVLLKHIIFIIVVYAILFYLNIKLTLIISVFIPLFFIPNIFMDKKMKEYYKNFRKKNELYIANIVEFFQSFFQVKIFNTFRAENSRAKQKYDDYLSESYIYFKYANKRQTYYRFLSSVLPVYLAFVAYIFLLYNLTTAGELFAFWGLYSLILSSTMNFSNIYMGLLKVIVIYEKYEDNIFHNLSEGETVELEQINTIEKIICKNCCYVYPNQTKNKIILPLMEFTNGGCYEIKGDSGIGKTTLLKLLLGILEPTEGSITINNIKLNEINKKKLYENIGYVEQNGYIYSRSLKENILLGRKFELEKWNRAVDLSQMKNIIDSLANKEKHLIGENGHQISGGERQRILIARALYHQPQWLFMDEPFVGIDIEKQKSIEKLIQTISKELTVVLVTHQKLYDLKIKKTINLK